MDFVGSNLYYILCATALIILIIVLIVSNLNKRSPAPKKANISPFPEKHTPKYAAGDEMDRINKSYYTQPHKRKFSSIPGIVFLIVAVVALFAYRTKINSKILHPNSPSNTAFTSSSADNELELQLKSDYSSDRSKIYVTCTYNNQGIRSFFSLRTRIDLLGENDHTLQSVTTDEINRIGPKEIKEITTAIEIEPQNSGKIKRISGHVEYQYMA